MKQSNYTRTPHKPVRPIDPTGQTGRLLPNQLQRLTGQTTRAHRSVLSIANFDRQHPGRPHSSTPPQGRAWVVRSGWGLVGFRIH